jgi:hypothetical protein
MASARRRNSWQRQTFLAFVVLLLFAISIGITYLYFYGSFMASERRIQERQRTLLYKSDHKGLEEAMRVVWNAHKGSDATTSNGLSPDDPALPALIRALDAHWMCVFQSGVSIELGSVSKQQSKVPANHRQL